MALEIFKLVGSVFVDTGAAEKSLQKTDKNAEGVGTKLLNAGKKAGKFALATAKAAGAAGAAIVALAETTREYRTEQGKLQAAFETQNFSTETARKTYESLNGVLGDSGQAVEAANHLAQLATSEDDLAKMTDSLTGVYATFGDSLPLEGLAEAMNHTAKLGEVQGPLADALEWSGVSTSDFNESLAKCNTEQERAALITETLSSLYDEAGEKYKEINADVIAANEAQEKFKNAMADVGAVIDPFVTKGKELLAEVLLKLIPALEWCGNTALPWVSNAVSGVITWFDGLIGKLGDSGFTFQTVMDTVKAMFEQTMENAKMIWETIGQPVWDCIKQAVQLVSDYFKERMPQIQEFVQTCFTDIRNLWNNNLRPALQAVGDFIENVLAPAFKWVFENVITPVADAAFKGIGSLWDNSLKPILEAMISFVKNVFSGNFAGAWKNVLDAFGGVWEGIITVVKTPINAAIGLINSFIGSVNGLKIPDWVPGMGGSGILNLPTIPLLAEGGVLERGQVGLLEGSGAEAVVPLEQNRRWIGAVARDMDAALGGSSDTSELLRELIELQERTLRVLMAGTRLQIGEREFGRLVREYA